MIRVFGATDTDFSTNGDAVIIPIKSRVKNNINGEFSYELTCEAKFYDYLRENKLLLVDTPQGVQPFRINNNVTRKGNRVTVKARHVFYDASTLVIADSYAVDMTCLQAMNHFNEATDTPSPFRMASNNESVNTFRCVRKSLLEALNTILERWGGYLIRDYWNITINNSIGQDNGITIEYKKNLQELTANYDFNNVVTKALPVGKDGVLLPELYVYSDIQYEVPYTKVISISQDLNSEDFPDEESYTQALITDLREQAQKYVNANCTPLITYTLKGKPEVVSDIGDIIRVHDSRIGVDITTQVIGYEYDTITGSYASLTFGNFANGLGNLMGDVKSTANEVVNEAMGEVRTNINKIYELLQGSYVVYRGYDILVLDAIPQSVAQHVLRFSNNGISISEDGVNGTYKEVYSLETQTLTVPKLLLDGLDVKEELDKKLDSDDLIAGDGIKITQSLAGLVISTTGGGGGGALKYWRETSNALYSENVIEGDTWHAIDLYYFDYEVRWEGHAYADRYFGKENAIPALIGWASIMSGGRGWGVPVILSDNPDGVIVWGSYGGAHQTYQGSFEYKGKTWYIGATAGYLENGSSPAPSEGKNYQAFYGFTPPDSPYYHASYPDFVTAGKALIDFSELSFDVTRYSGMARGEDLAYFAGATDNIGTGAKLKIYADGRTEGFDKVEDVKLNNNSIVANKSANIVVTGDHTTVQGNSVTIDSNLNMLGYGSPTGGVNGDTYSKYKGIYGDINYLRFIISDTRGHGISQLSEINFKDDSDSLYDWTGTTISSNCATPGGESAVNLIDGSTGTKACFTGFAPTTSNPVIITFTLGSAIDLGVYCFYDWYTANDESGRDPISWTIQASNDGEGWTTLAQETNATIPYDRYSLAFTGELDTGSTEFTLTGDQFLKVKGTWLKIPKLTPVVVSKSAYSALPSDTKNDATKIFFVTPNEGDSDYSIYYLGEPYTTNYTAGENIDITTGVISDTLPFKIVNGELCQVYDDGL